MESLFPVENDLAVGLKGVTRLDCYWTKPTWLLSRIEHSDFLLHLVTVKGTWRPIGEPWGSIPLAAQTQLLFELGQ